MLARVHSHTVSVDHSLLLPNKKIMRRAAIRRMFDPAHNFAASWKAGDADDDCDEADVDVVVVLFASEWDITRPLCCCMLFQNAAP